jgi:hypothetical protein
MNLKNHQSSYNGLFTPEKCLLRLKAAISGVIINRIQ